MTALTVRKGGAAPVVTVHKVAGQWAVAERDDYPADIAKLRRLLFALGDAKIVEEKTSSPANFSIIGVEDPSQPGAMSAQVTVAARDGEHSVIIGKPQKNAWLRPKPTWPGIEQMSAILKIRLILRFSGS